MARFVRWAALTAATALLVTGCSSGADEGDDGKGGGKSPSASSSDTGAPLPASLTSQKLDWGECEATDDSAAPGGDWRCATLEVPLDWAKPEGQTIGIALIRAEATGDDRIGSLLFNFGGPGGSGVSMMPYYASTASELHKRYDLVSFDPRGVAASEGVRCRSDKEIQAAEAVDATPDTPAEETAYLEDAAAFGKGCAKAAGPLMAHVSTTDTARDMDLMRQVLGDDKMHYFGISYGTELGGVYAHLFPKRVGRAVFDAVVDPTQDPEQGSLGQAKGFQLALDNFAEDCVSQVEDCPIGDSAEDVKDRIATLLTDLDRTPLPGIFPRDLTQTAATNGIAQALYSKDFWPYLTEGLQQAYDGDGRILMLLSDSMNGRSENGEYSNITAANVSINCADDKPRYTAEYVESKLPEFRRASALFGDFLAWGMISCTDWPVDGAADHPDVSAPGSAPILVVGNTGDPATPYEGARKMVRALGAGVGVELTYKGQGHGAYDSKNKCVQNAVDGYLLDGKVPAAGTVCS